VILRELESVRDFVLRGTNFRNWTIPTLILLGEKSGPQYRDTADALHACLPGSRIAVLEGRGHGAIDADPGYFADTVKTFLKDGS
jgi:pimeloyl-ACP methyl ester carboxylesterase